MTILEMRKWINSLPKEFDSYDLVHREYYDTDEESLYANEIEVYSVHIDEDENKGCFMHQESYMKYKGDDIYTKLEVKDFTSPTHG